jgi:hypothetical protein
MIQKPLTQTLEDRHTHSMELDPDRVARSFGVALPVGAPLPESPVDDAPGEIMLDVRAPRPAPAASILEIVMRRLRSLTPQTDARKEEIQNAIAVFAIPLEALDLLVAETEQEHFDAISTRWEQCRKRGRELVDETIPKLQGEVYKWQQESQKSGEAKAHRGQDAQTYFFQRAKISQWASQKEIASADKRLADAKEASASATALALEDQRSLAVAESALATAQNHLEKLKKELHRLEAELRGDAYFDTETGLSRSPLAHREKW